MSEPRMSLVIPCYNEARNLPLLVERCRKTMPGDEIEIVLVDNGSTDNTPQVLQSLSVGSGNSRSVRVEKNEGYGHGILSGLRAARGEILAWTHADMQTDPADALRGFAFFETAPEPETLFVKGRRHGRPLADRIFTAGMSAFETVLFRAPFRDINAQPTMFHRAFFKTWDDPPKDFSLDLYAYYMANAQGLKTCRFPVTFGERAFGHSHWNVNWQAKIKVIRRTLGYSFKLKKRMRTDAGQAAG
jgi:polyisoprenyl-phosphate glycosyltransferase